MSLHPDEHVRRKRQKLECSVGTDRTLVWDTGAIGFGFRIMSLEALLLISR
jgi:hypothetical protein